MPDMAIKPIAFDPPDQLDGLTACVVYKRARKTPMVASIYDLKFGGMRGEISLDVATGIAWNLSAVLARVWAWRGAYVVCVPSAPSRALARGYNQSELLARALALRVGAPYLDVLRSWERDSAVKSKTRLGRAKALRGSMYSVGDCHGADVVVVDDIYTTGATLSECGRVLRNAGAYRIFGLVVAGALFA